MTKAKKQVKGKSSSVVSPVAIVLIIAVALVVVGGLIVLNNESTDVDLSQFPTRGDPNAPVTIIEYSDYGCSHCRDFALNTLPLLEAEYIDTGKVKFVVHPFHFDGPGLALAVEAAWCAQDQGKFFEYQHALFEHQGMSLDATNLLQVAGDVGIDTNALAQCINDGTHRNDVGRAHQAASSRGVNSTPTFFINNRRVVGNQPYETFKKLIEQELAAQ